MPVNKGSNGKWRIGGGECIYATKAQADEAYIEYLAQPKSISGTLQEMAAGEIKKAIDLNKYNEILVNDKSPLFKAFVIGHEGESEGKMVGYGNVIKKWLKPAVKKIFDKLKLGTKIFKGHGITNDHAGREPIGEIVGKALKIIKDKLSVVGLVYVKPEHKADDSDVSSMETTFTMNEDSTVVDIGDITGVAIDNSAKSTPGFPGATLQGALQEFAKAHDNGEGEKNMNIDEIKKEIEAGKYKPGDFFERDDIEKIDYVIGLRKSKKRTDEKFDAKNDEFTKMEKSKAEWVTEKQEFEKTIKGYKIKDLKNSVVGDFEKKMKDERKLDERQQKFARKNWDKFEPSGLEVSVPRELDTFIDKQVDAFKEMETIFKTEESNTGNSNAGNQGISVGVGAGDTGKNVTDYKDPAQNPMIPKKH